MDKPHSENPQTFKEFDEYFYKLLKYLCDDPNFFATSCHKVKAPASEPPPFLVYRFLGETQTEQLDEFVNVVYRYELNTVSNLRDQNIEIAQKIKNFMRPYKIGVTIGQELFIEAKETFSLQLFLFYT